MISWKYIRGSIEAKLILLVSTSSPPKCMNLNLKILLKSEICWPRTTKNIMRYISYYIQIRNSNICTNKNKKILIHQEKTDSKFFTWKNSINYFKGELIANIQWFPTLLRWPQRWVPNSPTMKSSALWRTMQSHLKLFHVHAPKSTIKGK